MPQSLADLEQQRATILRQISELDDFRAGSITGTGGRCGNAGCHCHRPGDPGHRAHPRLTYKVNGKTVTESFATPAEQRKVEREIEAFRRYKQLERSFVEINENICRARTVEDTLSPQEKNLRRHPGGDRARNKRLVGPHLRGAETNGQHRSGSGGNGFSGHPASGRCDRPRSVATVPRACRGTAPDSLPMR